VKLPFLPKSDSAARKTPRASPVESAMPPKNNVAERVTDWFARSIGHGDPDKMHGPNILTHERVVAQTSAFVGFAEIGVTFSELNQIRKHKGTELVHVVNPDGSSNLELILSRFTPKWLEKMIPGCRLGLQGPALNTTRDGKVGARFVGFEVTGDIETEHSKDAVSYTLEVKVTEKSVVELAKLAVPGAAAKLGELLASEGSSVVQNAIGNAFLIAVPIISSAIAVVSVRNAIKVCDDAMATKEQKAFAVGHAVADCVRVVLPIPGTLMNVALVGAAGISTGIKFFRARADAKAAATNAAAMKAKGDDG